MKSENTEVLEQMKIIGDLAPCGIGLYDLETSEPVSYTHLDVYKRQVKISGLGNKDAGGGN